MGSKSLKADREYPSLSILCAMYEAAKDPEGMNDYYGTFGTKACEAYNQACADLGDRVHKHLEDWELGSPEASLSKPTDPREFYMCQLIKDWVIQSGMKAVNCHFSENGKAIEVKLDSKLLKFSCRADRIVTFGSDPTKWVGDYKTSAEMKDSYKLQLAGYALGWFEKTGEWIDDGFILRVDKKPKAKVQLEPIEVHDLHEWLEPLVLTRHLWDFINGKGIYAASAGLYQTWMEPRSSTSRG